MDPPKLLLDTHALIWWAISDKRLSRKVRSLIEDEQTVVFVSSASAWEIATKVRLGRLTWSSPGSVESYCRNQGFELLSISVAHAERAGSWPQEHGDPFDRMLAAQGEREQLPVATNDPKIKLFDVATIW
ncbi:MAG TPA: type II toxin-antitoxin system VapC family toxin [Steroidobacteraceae bacterium]|nr:type II toxin-antitoxin system VapC family toxin [Steroidobacteraceae bacterium]